LVFLIIQVKLTGRVIVLPAGWWSGYWVLQAALTTCRVKRWQWKLERIMIKQGFFFLFSKN